MSVTVRGVVMKDVRDFYAQIHGGLYTPDPAWRPVFTRARFGEGGWQLNVSGSKVPRSPDGTLRRVDNSVQDVDAAVDATRAAPDQRYSSLSQWTYDKLLTPDVFSWSSGETGVLHVDLRLLSDEANIDVHGNTPTFWEVGLFIPHPSGTGEIMWGYATFQGVMKTGVEVDVPLSFTF